MPDPTTLTPDQERRADYEAIGWLASCVGSDFLNSEADRAEAAGCDYVAIGLRSMAGINALNPRPVSAQRLETFASYYLARSLADQPKHKPSMIVTNDDGDFEVWRLGTSGRLPGVSERAVDLDEVHADDDQLVG